MRAKEMLILSSGSVSVSPDGILTAYNLRDAFEVFDMTTQVPQKLRTIPVTATKRRPMELIYLDKGPLILSNNEKELQILNSSSGETIHSFKLAHCRYF